MRTRWVQAKEWWLTLAPRERKAIMIGGSVVLIFIVYQWILTPYLDSIASMRKRINTAQENLVLIQATDQEIKNISQEIHQQGPTPTPVMLLTILQKQINEAGLNHHLRELRQVTNETIALRFQNIDFDKMVKLLTDISKQQHITITQLSAVRKKAPGIVDADITLTLG